jgi:hypothetical protein
MARQIALGETLEERSRAQRDFPASRSATDLNRYWAKRVSVVRAISSHS